MGGALLCAGKGGWEGYRRVGLEPGFGLNGFLGWSCDVVYVEGKETRGVISGGKWRARCAQRHPATGKFRYEDEWFGFSFPGGATILDFPILSVRLLSPSFLPVQLPPPVASFDTNCAGRGSWTFRSPLVWSDP